VLTNWFQVTIGAHDIVVFSKTTCPYCARVKGVFEELDATAHVVELNTLPNGGQLQAALAALSGQRTVPNVWVKGQHLGGCDDTMAAHKNGSLTKLLNK